jgi:hypothetical protein
MTMSCKIYNMSLQKYPGKWLWNKPHTFHNELGRLDKVKKYLAFRALAAEP